MAVRQLVSQLVSDKHSQWSDLGPIKACILLSWIYLDIQILQHELSASWAGGRNPATKAPTHRPRTRQWQQEEGEEVVIWEFWEPCMHFFVTFLTMTLWLTDNDPVCWPICPRTCDTCMLSREWLVLLCGKVFYWHQGIAREYPKLARAPTQWMPSLFSALSLLPWIISPPLLVVLTNTKMNCCRSRWQMTIHLTPMSPNLKLAEVFLKEIQFWCPQQGT